MFLVSELDDIEAPMITHGIRFVRVTGKLAGYRVWLTKTIGWMNAYAHGQWAEQLTHRLTELNSVLEELEETLRDMSVDFDALYKYNKTQAQALDLQSQELTNLILKQQQERQQ